MHSFPWFPVGYALAGGPEVGRLVLEGPGFQLISGRTDDRVSLVVEADAEAGRDVAAGPEAVRQSFESFDYAGARYLAATFRRGSEPITLQERVKRGPLGGAELGRMAAAVAELLGRVPDADLPSAILLPSRHLIAVRRDEAEGGRQAFAVSLLTGGVALATLSNDRIRSFNSRVSDRDIAEFLAAFDGRSPAGAAGRAGDPSGFSLPGRPKLERFFREHVIEPSLDRARYEALGVRMPNGILLHGPTGSGKSHAVARLKQALGWPVFEIDLGAVGSPYIHQTSVALRQVFEEARAAAPSLVLIEEIDALAAARGPMSHDHKVEEITELLKLVEKAARNGTLVIATTNRRDVLDPALLRRGRFDHAVEIGYPDADEVLAVLTHMLEARPHADLPNLVDIAKKLANRPMSDLEWVVNEAARRTAQSNRNEISEFDLLAAVARLRSS